MLLIESSLDMFTMHTQLHSNKAFASISSLLLQRGDKSFNFFKKKSFPARYCSSAAIVDSVVYPYWLSGFFGRILKYSYFLAKGGL